MKVKKIIYSYIKNNETKIIVDYLKQKANWDPVFFHGYSDMQKWLDSKYPNAGLVDSNKLRKGFFDYSQLGDRRPIDSEIIKNLSNYESNYISWIEDTTGRNFSYFERRKFYYDMLTYWNTVITKYKPNLFISYTWPHLSSDFALYLLCRYHYKIPVIFTDITPFFNKYYYNIGCSLEDLSLPFKDYYHSKESLIQSDVVKEYLSKLRSKNPNLPNHITKLYNKLKINNSRGRVKNYLRIIYLFLTGRAFKESISTFKSSTQPWGTKGSLLSNLGEFIFLEKMIYKNKSLKKKYAKLLTEIDSSDKYIYFAAPYQPEAISNISCGVYENSFLILDMISNAIPDNWKIYYKEHPATFKEIYKGALQKDKYYYNNLSKFKNIKFISPDEDTFKLIDYSQAVATVGGTVGWEAVVRGKPTLLFGNLWYQECKSVFSIKNFNDLEIAISKIINGYKPSENDVNRYAQSLYLASKKIITLTNFDDIRNSENPESEMIKVAEFILTSKERLYPEQ